ncbi:hypothetical protein [Micromonospora sp. S-DT3-3-22]|uniref:hypothetical protein n=1 Tax=Micromonospora sp. S-DT3-3-22 TaxID=2755359 RepID=UPI00188F9634|nr:hypothetical protein [Micromonospora sp. S-DT3-3-22]
MSIEDVPNAYVSPVDSQPDRPHLLVWQDELKASPGYRAVELMAYVRRIGYVLQANVAQYNDLIARLQDPSHSLPIFDISNPEVHDDLLSEVERLLHNVLMALSTRIDQQRRFMKKHFSDDAALTVEYAERVRTGFDDYAPSAFLRGLRNYLTHHRLPVAQSQQTFSPQSFSVTFVLLCQPLLEWSRWNSDIKRWIASRGDCLEIVSMIDGYARIAGDFDKWLHDRIGLKYASEIREYEDSANAFNRELDRTFGQ